MIPTKADPDMNDLIPEPGCERAGHTVFGVVRARPEKQTTERTTAMKTKTAKQPKQSKRGVQLKDIKPKNNPRAGALVAPLKKFSVKNKAGKGGLHKFEQVLARASNP